MPNLVTFSGMAESEQRKTGAGSDQEVEKDEADNRMEEGEHLLDESDSEDALVTAAKAHPGNPRTTRRKVPLLKPAPTQSDSLQATL